MSDFLHNMARRGAGTLTMPHLEPPTELPFSPGEPWREFEEEATEAAGLPEPRLARTPPAERSPALPPESRVVLPPAALPASPPRTVPERAVMPLPPSETPDTSQLEASFRQPSPPTASVPFVPPIPARIAPAIRESVPVTTEPRFAPILRERTAPLAAAPRATQGANPPALPPTPRRESEASAPPEPVRARPVTPEPRLPERIELPDTPPAARPKSPEAATVAPSVVVRIGRVEVQLTPPAREPAPPPTPAWRGFDEFALARRYLDRMGR